MSGDKIIICPGAIYNKRVEQQNIFGVVNVYSSNKGAKDSQTVSSLQQIDCYVDEDNKNDESSKNEEVQNASPHEMNFPEVEPDKTLFHTSLRVNVIKGTLYRLIAKEKQDGSFCIAHWFIVWKVFTRYKFTIASQAAFIRWVKAVYGWEWKTENFKGSVVLDSLKKIRLDEWTEENISGQAKQAEGYIRWKDTLIDTFLEKETDTRMQCKKEFCFAWFDTN